MIPPKIARHTQPDTKPEKLSLLNYSIAQERLTGTLDHDDFTMRAYSGGGRGRKGDGAENSWSSYQTTRQESGASDAKNHVHGGPVPRGWYKCVDVSNHPKFHECVRLDQLVTEDIVYDKKKHSLHHTRSGFYIHGRGAHGSDGCIVHFSETERRRLNKAIRNIVGSVVLAVSEAGMPLPAEETPPPRFIV